MRRLSLGLLVLLVSAGAAVAQAPPAQEKKPNPCRDQVAAALSKLRKSSWFRMTTQMLSEQGPMSMVVDYVLPDRMHQTLTRKLNGESSEVILVGMHAWANQGKGWTSLPYNIANDLRAQMYDNVIAEQADVGEYTCVGKATVDGREALSYKLVEAPDPEAKTPRNEAYRMFYVDAMTGLPVSTEILAPGREKAPIFKAVYSYPLDIKIDPPKGVINPGDKAPEKGGPAAAPPAPAAGDKK